MRTNYDSRRSLTGSSDTILIFYNQDAFLAHTRIHGIRKLLPYPHSPAFSVAHSARLVLYRKCDGLELWRLGVGDPPVKILDMELKKVSCRVGGRVDGSVWVSVIEGRGAGRGIRGY